jgi:hypothetical protein
LVFKVAAAQNARLEAEKVTAEQIGMATPADKHLAPTIHRIDDGIIEWLEKRERRKRNKSASAANVRR